MKTKIITIVLLLSTSCIFAISESHYKTICQSKANLSLQGQMICKKHAKHIRPDSTYKAPEPTSPQITQKASSKPKPASKPVVQQPSLSSKQRRERLNFKPYVPGGYAVKTEENNE